MAAGLGRGRLSRGWSIQGKLEKRGVDPDAEPTAATSEEKKKDEQEGMAANTHHHPDRISPVCLFCPQQHLRGWMQVCDADPQLCSPQITERRRVQRQRERGMEEEEKGRGPADSDDDS